MKENKKDKKIVIGVWGCGRLGGSVIRLFKEIGNEKIFTVLKYDKYNKKIKSDYPEDLIVNSDFLFICLPTPMGDDGRIDLSYIDNAMSFIASIGKRKKEQLIIIRSTVVPGTCDNYEKMYPKLKIAMVPEFLTENGDFWDEVVNPSRIIFGVKSKQDTFKLHNLFSYIFDNDIPFFFIKRKEAEMYKYACNTFLGMNVLVANQLKQICDALGVEYSKIQPYFIYDKRIGTHTLVPGTDGMHGIGGKCLPKDIDALIECSEDNGYRPSFLTAGMNFNDEIREEKDWLSIPGAVSSCGFENKKKKR